MLDQGNRTFIGSVVFVDIVGYSKRTVSEQITIKDRFTALLSDALVDIPAEQRLILDTGDGAALSFLGDPEDALFVSMSMRDIITRAAAEAGTPMPTSIDEVPADGALPLRIGINLGPVKLVRDINGHPNIVGDGINVAQRIMSFAQPGQIVVSRSFYDVVSVISDEYAKLFRYEGSRTDKHVREHEIYVVGESDAAFNKAKAGMVDRAASTNPMGRPPGAVSTGTFGFRQTNSQAEPLPFLQDRKKLTIAGVALGAVVFALLLALLLKKPSEPAPEVATAVKPVQVSKADAAKPAEAPKIDAAATAAPAVPPGDAAKPAEVPGAGAAAGGTGVTTTPTTAASGEAKPAAARPEVPKPDAAKTDATKTLVLGNINFHINPWGDVYVNGKSIGVSPPLKQHKLAPGKYKIEVKNTSFTPYVTNIEVKPKEDVSVKYTFR